MKLYYYRDPNLNFGDDLNPWIWSRLLPDFFNEDSSELFVGIGTLLNHRIPPAKKRLVFGSGFGYGNLPVLDSSWEFACVRGPLTAQKLALPASTAVVDPAVFISDLYPFRDHKKIHKIAFMPHCASAVQGDWQQVCSMAGIHYIDPRQSVDIVMAELAGSTLLLAEAMHGAIAAEAFRVPWIPLVCYDHISEFKWRDWCESLELTYQPQHVHGIYRGDREKPLRVRSKHILKRVLRGCGVWSSDWQLPPPQRSSSSAYEQAAEGLRNIAASVEPMLAKDAILKQRLDELYSRLRQVQTTNRIGG